MTESDLVTALAARARVAPGDVRAVLGALAEVAGGQASGPVARTPGDDCVEHLIAEARRHPLGLEFLLEGEPGCVAATFGAHAFTVDAARRRLAANP